jgi:hypothetical protein
MGEEQARVRAEHWRPGFAKRSETFEDQVLPTARTWRWSPEVTWWRVQDAVLQGGAWELTETERRMLMLYLGRVNQERLEQQSDAGVWPSEGWMQRRLEVDPRTIRRARRSLEAKGWLVRDYNQANRPNGMHAVDLAPTFARLEEMELRISLLNADLEDEREGWGSSSLPPQAAIDPEDGAAAAAGGSEAGDTDVRPGGHGCPPKQSQSNQSWEVRARADVAHPGSESGPDIGPASSRPDRSTSPAGPAGPASSPPARMPRAPGATTGRGQSPPGRAGAGDGAIRSPRGASGPSGAPPAGSVRPEIVREELQLALEVCPRLKPYVDARLAEDPASATPQDAGRFAHVAQQLLPEGDRNNGVTLLWGWDRHGARVVAMLAIALEDPKVENPCRYFGGFVVKDGTNLDLRLNLRRMLRARGMASPAQVLAAPGADHPTWLAIGGELRARIREGAWGSWFSRVGFTALEDGVLVLSSPSGLAVQRIKDEFGREIRAAARAAGFEVLKVMVTRSTAPPAAEASRKSKGPMYRREDRHPPAE